MLDRKFIVDNAEAVKKNCADRGVQVDVDRFLDLDKQRRDLLPKIEELNRQANDLAKTIGKAKDDAEREAIKAQGRTLREQKTSLEADAEKLTGELDLVQRRIPNMTHPAAPVGKDDHANTEVRQGA